MKPLSVGSALLLLALSACARLGAQQLAQQPGGEQSVVGPAGAIYVDDGGGKDGIPVVFLHSFGGDSSHWGSQLAHTRHDRRALAIDLRGHGKSAAPKDNDYAVDSFVKDLEAVVDKLGLKRFVLVGHSLGGSIAIKYAGRYPGRVAGLVVVGAPGKIPPEQAQQTLAAIEANYDTTMKGYWEKLVGNAQPHVRTQILGQMDRVPKDASLAIMGALFKDDPLASLDRYPGPKLIISTGPFESPHDLHKARPNIPHRRIEGTSHWPHLDKPGDFNGVLEEFLAQVK